MRIRLALLGLTAPAVLAAAYVAYLRSDAYRHGNRLFYRAGRPNEAGRLAGDAWAALAAVGLTPAYMVALETVGHRSGRRRSIPVVLADHEGGRYLVSMLGERSPWVHNIRAAGGRAAIRHGGRTEVTCVEIPAGERAPILRAYLERAPGGRPHIPVDRHAPLADFEAIAASYPVFRIDPVPATG